MYHKLEPDRPWTPYEVKFLKWHWFNDHAASYIAKKLKRSKNSVIGKIHRMGWQRLEQQPEFGPDEIPDLVERREPSPPRKFSWQKDEAA